MIESVIIITLAVFVVLIGLLNHRNDLVFKTRLAWIDNDFKSYSRLSVNYNKMLYRDLDCWTQEQFNKKYNLKGTK